jgi:hypothetical protein
MSYMHVIYLYDRLKINILLGGVNYSRYSEHKYGVTGTDTLLLMGVSTVKETQRIIRSGRGISRLVV